MTPKKRFVLSQKTIISVGIVLAVILASATVLVSIHQNNEAENIQAQPKPDDFPKYATILPTGKSIDALGGWSRISPPKSDPVYAYTDKIRDISISVSQQPLPASFENDIDRQVSETAEKFNASSKITAGDTMVHIGTSAQGPQSVIFSKNNVLVLIKSQQKIDEKDWANYIKSLH